MKYYYTDVNGQARGPVSIEELRSRIADGYISHTALACEVGADQWSSITRWIEPHYFPVAHVQQHPPIGNVPFQTRNMLDPFSIISLVISLVAILSWTFCCLGGGLLAIPAIVVGHLSLNNIKNDPNLTGKGIAIAALVISYINLIISVLFIVGFFGLLLASE
ncbi:MAG: DUF4190 domain-containing protein [Lentisphaeria bacterium]|nr:DUF4190 domain-containing protein [Lentisphaeria bacterium]